MALSTVTLKWNLTDLVQGGQTATLVITPSAQMADSTDHVLVAQPVPRRVVFSGGQGQLAGIIANDNASILPTGTGYTIEVVTSTGAVIVPAFTTQLLTANGATQWLDQLAPVSPVTTGYLFLPLPSGAPVAGDVPVVTSSGSEATTWQPVSGGGAVSSVFGRTGAVVATTGDYTATQVGADASGAAATAQANAIAACQPADLNELLTAPTGATGETIPRAIATATSGTMASGTVYARAIGLRSGVPVNGITLYNTASTEVTLADLTHGWYVLCDKNMVVRAVSADQTGVAFFTAFNTGYSLSVAASAYTTTYTGLYYVGVMIAISAGSMPGLAIGGNTSTGVAQASPVLYGSSSTGQTAPPVAGSSLAAVSFLTGFNFYAWTS